MMRGRIWCYAVHTHMHHTTRPAARPKPARSRVRTVRKDAAEVTPKPKFKIGPNRAGLRRSQQLAAPPKKYTTPQELADLIRIYRKMRRRMQPTKLARLEEIVTKMATGIWTRFRPIESKDDFVNECWVQCLMKVFHKIKEGGNAFNYITTVFINTGKKMRAEEGMNRSAEDGYRSRYISAERFAYTDPDPE